MINQQFWIRIKLPTGGWVERPYSAPNEWIALQHAELEHGPGNCDLPKEPNKGVDNRS